MLPLDELRAVVDDAITHRIFPGAVVYLSRGESVFAHEAFGTTACDAEYSRPVTTRTLYDLASLTKLFTATAFLIASREAAVDARTPLHQFFPQFQRTDKSGISLRHLLMHSSGIRIAIQDLTEYSPEEWIARIAAAPLDARPGRKVLYSCTNYFLLARVIETLCGVPLDEFIAARVLAPLGARRLTFNQLQHFAPDEIAPTEVDVKTGRLFHGDVHDEAARAWQEYSGHASCGNAGLFANAEGIAQFACLWCNDGVINGQPVHQPSEIADALGDTLPDDAQGTRRGWSWQLDAKFSMSEKAPPGSIGHSGFTGPTLWLNRATGDICAILNNRVYPTRHRPERFPVHRRIARWLNTLPSRPAAV
jgi:CubicO group peptidase (beta-lactamase class C family)